MTDPGRDAAAAMVGGAGGSLLVSTLIRAGVAPKPAAVAVAIVGGLAALGLRGMARHVALGAAAASLGRLALTWMQAKAGSWRHERDGTATRVTRARSELARDDEGSTPVIQIPEPGQAGGKDEDAEGGADAGVAVSEVEGGVGVSDVSSSVRDPERGVPRGGNAVRNRPEGGGVGDAADAHAGLFSRRCDRWPRGVTCRRTT